MIYLVTDDFCRFLSGDLPEVKKSSEGKDVKDILTPAELMCDFS